MEKFDIYRISKEDGRELIDTTDTILQAAARLEKAVESDRAWGLEATYTVIMVGGDESE